MSFVDENHDIVVANENRIQFDFMAKFRIHFKAILLLFYVLSICATTFYLALKKIRNENVDESLLSGRFWVLTDSHVDESYRIDGDPETYCHEKLSTNSTDFARKYGHPHCNPPKELLISALRAARQFDSSVDFLIWMGDATSHQFGQNDSTLLVNFHLAKQLRKYFPQTPIFPVLGNHDIVLPTDPKRRFEEFYHHTNFSLLLTDEKTQQTFLRGGYYSYRYRPKNGNDGRLLRFVTLNTGMFEPRNVKYFDPDEGLKQIEWFNRTMAEAFHLNDRVFLLSHTPFGINENLLYRYYPLNYEQKLLSIIDRFSSSIVMCFTGHRHQDIIRLYSSRNTTLGILSHPAISPISWLTNPSIRRYFYNRTSFDLIDYEQFSLNLIETERTKKDQWKLAYRFSSWYQQSKTLTSETLLQLIYLIRTDSFYLQRFLLLKHSAETTTLTNQKILQTLCALTLFNFDDLIICTKKLQGELNFVTTLNNSFEFDVHQREELLQYRRIYRRVATFLFLFSVLFLFFVFRICRTSKFSCRRN